MAEGRRPVEGKVSSNACSGRSAGLSMSQKQRACGSWGPNPRSRLTFDESPLRESCTGIWQPGTVVADVLPHKVFHGHVLSLAPGTGAVFSVIPPENATGNFTKIVQRVPVRIGLDDARLGELRPGLSTTVSVDTKPGAPAEE